MQFFHEERQKQKTYIPIPILSGINIKMSVVIGDHCSKHIFTKNKLRNAQFVELPSLTRSYNQKIKKTIINQQLST